MKFSQGLYAHLTQKADGPSLFNYGIIVVS